MHYIDVDTGERLPIYEPEWKVETNGWENKEGSIMIKSRNAASSLTSKEKGEEEREREETDCSSKNLSAKMFQNPIGFTTELSSNPNYWRLGRRG